MRSARAARADLRLSCTACHLVLAEERPRRAAHAPAALARRSALSRASRFAAWIHAHMADCFAAAWRDCAAAKEAIFRRRERELPASLAATKFYDFSIANSPVNASDAVKQRAQRERGLPRRQPRPSPCRRAVLACGANLRCCSSSSCGARAAARRRTCCPKVSTRRGRAAHEAGGRAPTGKAASSRDIDWSNAQKHYRLVTALAPGMVDNYVSLAYALRENGMRTDRWLIRDPPREGPRRLRTGTTCAACAARCSSRTGRWRRRRASTVGRASARAVARRGEHQRGHGVEVRRLSRGGQDCVRARRALAPKSVEPFAELGALH